MLFHVNIDTVFSTFSSLPQMFLCTSWDIMPSMQINLEYLTEKFNSSFSYKMPFSASLSAVSTGTVIAWMAQISPKLLDGEYGFPIDESELSWIGSLLSVGAACLSLFIGHLCKFFGCKTTMLLLIVPITVGWSLITWATNVYMIYGGRFLTGMVAGCYCVTSPLYSSEISEDAIRGTLGSFMQLMLNAGLLLAVIISKFAELKIYNLCCLMVPIVFGVLFVFVPESPVHYLRKGDEDSARTSLRRLRGKNYDVDEEMETIRGRLKDEESQGGFRVLKEAFKKRNVKVAFAISMCLMTLRVFSGIEAITPYASYIFEHASSTFDPQVGTIILISLQVTFVEFLITSSQ